MAASAVAAVTPLRSSFCRTSCAVRGRATMYCMAVATASARLRAAWADASTVPSWVSCSIAPPVAGETPYTGVQYSSLHGAFLSRHARLLAEKTFVALLRVAGKSVRKYTLRRYSFFLKEIEAKTAGL